MADHYVLSMLFLSFISNATLRDHRTELNRTSPHIWKYSRIWIN